MAETKNNELLTKNKLLRMDNVGIVVESLDGAISFFTETVLSQEPPKPDLRRNIV